METTPTARKSGFQVSLWGAITGMVVTFLLGIYVGVHPAWLPIKSSSEDFSMPAKVTIPPPTSEPAEMARTAQTQPDSAAH